MTNHSKEFLSQIRTSIEQDTFVRITLSRNKAHDGVLKKAIFKLALIKRELKLIAVYKQGRKDITKNYTLEEGFEKITDCIQNTFLIASLFTIEKDYVLTISKKTGKTGLSTKKPQFNTLPPKTHDKQKAKLITSNSYLVQLGILDEAGRVKKDKGDKYKQTNKFVEIFDGLLKKTPEIANKTDLKVLDMGAGKGYLTFALYDYLVNRMKLKAEVVGVEIREDLIKLCNEIAQNIQFKNLSFEKGFISDYELPAVDVLIALHACDTATDEAIFKGIQAKASLIICAPCCHKQIRKELNPDTPLDSITDFGILKERQAEIVTDTMRALLLEAAGYKSKVFEFISNEHTSKNTMIVGQKQERTINPQIFLNKMKALKETFGIQSHYLEKLLGMSA